ncbi:MAG: interleukin-like EMT inducer domain-containing protein [Candidatus Hydrogenedentota bacterium]
MRPILRLGLLWLLVLAVFAGFCAIYWPVRLYQWKTDPANFLVYADELIEEGATGKAVGVLESGIAELHPPGPAAYQKLHALLVGLGRETAARALEPRLFFARAHQAHETHAAMRDKLLARAASAYLDANPAPAFTPPVQQALEMMAVDLVQPLGAHSTIQAMPAAAHFALLNVAGGRFSLDGTVGGTGVAAPADILVQSGGGQGVHRTAHIMVHGQDYARSVRGIHVALIAPDSGHVLRHWAFDVYESPSEAARMTAFLREAPDGVIGAFAVFDDGSVHVTPTLERELRNFGMRRMARDHHEMVLIGLRHSFAAIGVKGAQPGTALQAWTPEEFNGYTGLPVAAGVLHAGDTS